MKISPMENAKEPRGYEFNKSYTLEFKLKALYNNDIIPTGSECIPQHFTSKTIIFIHYLSIKMVKQVLLGSCILINMILYVRNFIRLLQMQLRLLNVMQLKIN